VVAVPEGFDVLKEFPGVADSKKLSEKKREKIFEMLETRAAGGDTRFAVEFEDAETIDKEGIAVAVRRALARGVNALAPAKTAEGGSPGAANAALRDDIFVYLDGSLKALPEYPQETTINGDELVPIISLASIAAKVLRDRLMIEVAKKYPLYGFERHKGYGTALHYEMLEKYGLCAIHRRSFIHLDFMTK
jgi:ribonuclease HII